MRTTLWIYGLLLMAGSGCGYDPIAPTPIPPTTIPVIEPAKTPTPQPFEAPLSIALMVGPDSPEVGVAAAFSVITMQGYPKAPIAYDWDFGDGERVAGQDSVTFHAFQEAGRYRVAAIASDADGRSGTAVQFVEVRPSRASQPAPVVPPAASLALVVSCTGLGGAPHSLGCVVRPVIGEMTAPVTVAWVDWAWQDGTTSTAAGSSSAHLYTVAGNYRVEAVATLSDGRVVRGFTAARAE